MTAPHPEHPTDLVFAGLARWLRSVWLESPELVKRFVHKKFSCGFGGPVCACVPMRDGLMAREKSAESGVYRSADGRKFDAS